MTTTPIMTVSDLHKTYGKAGSKQYEALKGINFNVQPGEFVGIMGASGSGKPPCSICWPHWTNQLAVK